MASYFFFSMSLLLSSSCIFSLFSMSANISAIRIVSSSNSFFIFYIFKLFSAMATWFSSFFSNGTTSFFFSAAISSFLRISFTLTGFSSTEGSTYFSSTISAVKSGSSSSTFYLTFFSNDNGFSSLPIFPSFATLYFSISIRSSSSNLFHSFMIVSNDFSCFALSASSIFRVLSYLYMLSFSISNSLFSISSNRFVWLEWYVIALLASSEALSHRRLAVIALVLMTLFYCFCNVNAAVRALSNALKQRSLSSTSENPSKSVRVPSNTSFVNYWILKVVWSRISSDL